MSSGHCRPSFHRMNTGLSLLSVTMSVPLMGQVGRRQWISVAPNLRPCDVKLRIVFQQSKAPRLKQHRGLIRGLSSNGCKTARTGRPYYQLQRPRQKSGLCLQHNALVLLPARRKPAVLYLAKKRLYLVLIRLRYLEQGRIARYSLVAPCILHALPPFPLGYP